MAKLSMVTDIEGIRKIREGCTKILPGHPDIAPEREWAFMADWIKKNGASPDVYGKGKFIQEFERKVTKILGMEAGIFMPSGVMAQQIALRIWSDEAGTNHIGMHATSHPELHEKRAYSHVHGLRSTVIGPPDKPIGPKDLDASPEKLAALLIELPAREIGGQLPNWDDLQAIKAEATKRHIRLHLDGARLWEARAYYEDRDYATICKGFDSVYVSFYKGIGALSGALLAGPKDFIEKAKIWKLRLGGRQFTNHPAVVSAAMRIDERLSRMPGYFKKAQEFSNIARRVTGLVINPTPIQANMFHMHMAAPPERAMMARNLIAKDDKVWLFNHAGPARTPGWSMTEIYIGDNAMNLEANDLSPFFIKLVNSLKD